MNIITVLNVAITIAATALVILAAFAFNKEQASPPPMCYEVVGDDVWECEPMSIGYLCREKQ